jgi:hypothetical protein
MLERLAIRCDTETPPLGRGGAAKGIGQNRRPQPVQGASRTGIDFGWFRKGDSTIVGLPVSSIAG